ncbi:MAG: ABC transporter permease [Anaerolineales bacterium]|nr:ABC transporter permease [Anaerolineales bacterium]
MNALARPFRELGRYPSAVAGLVIVGALVALSVYTLITIPYAEAVRLWRGGDDTWAESPKNAQPAWLNWLPGRPRLPETLVLNSQADPALKTTRALSEATEIVLTLAFDYPYDAFPQELTIFFAGRYQTKQPYVSLSWLTPDGRTIRLGDFSIQATQDYRLGQDARLVRRLKGQPPEQALFADPAAAALTPLKGRYTLQVSGLAFEPGADIDAKLVVYGQVHGLAGTDHRRRDLMVALLWGTPVALAFGLLASLGTTVVTMLIAAAGTWFGGWVDGLVQRLTEINLILPFLPILIMIGTLYSRSLWTMLGASILLTIFGGAIKGYRAIFLQVKEAPYIEAARVYGASHWRVILFYLMPRIVPILIPQLVGAIPAFVFLEASLSVLGLGDPVLPTWGKLIDDARANGALFQGQYYWVLEPSVLLMVTGLAFAMLGFALDRVFNPRLREV